MAETVRIPTPEVDLDLSLLSETLIQHGWNVSSPLTHGRKVTDLPCFVTHLVATQKPMISIPLITRYALEAMKAAVQRGQSVALVDTGGHIHSHLLTRNGIPTDLSIFLGDALIEEVLHFLYRAFRRKTDLVVLLDPRIYTRSFAEVRILSSFLKMMRRELSEFESSILILSSEEIECESWFHLSPILRA